MPLGELGPASHPVMGRAAGADHRAAATVTHRYHRRIATTAHVVIMMVILAHDFTLLVVDLLALLVAE